ncbi:MAG: sulfite exporter TauE/SafE family protein [Anaerolineales bacterium]|jgi:hypothetical protein
MQVAFLLAIVFLAVFTQSLAGFGSALIAMGLLVPLLGIHTATPLVAAITLLLEIFLVVYYREALKISHVWRLVAAAVIGIPLGVLFLKQIDEQVMMLLLGIVITSYALYALLRFRLPRLERPAWAYLFGVAAGMLGGAYNTSGPPVIIYGHCRRWSPSEFKGNLQGFFLISSTLVAITHLAGGSFTPEIWHLFLLSLPALGAGLFAGLQMEKRIQPAVFNWIVLGLLVVLGLRLIISFFVI